MEQQSLLGSADFTCICFETRGYRKKLARTLSVRSLCAFHRTHLLIPFLDEQTILHKGRRNDPNGVLPDLGESLSAKPPASRVNNAPRNDHLTRDQVTDTTRFYMVPSPQRGRGDGSGKVYTKSPSYADNYEKTKKVTKISVVERDGEPTT